MSDVSQFIPAHPLNTAVLFIVFNRLDTTKQVFESIRESRPPRLYIAADGARINKQGEAEKVAAVRDYIMQNISWECEVKTLFREQNIGCKYAPSSAISWFFENEEQGIILEDDCLPSQSFFWFCEELLERYKDDFRIMHIDGTNFTNESIPFNSSYDFSSYALIWGWATWRRAWRKYDIELSHLDEFASSGYLRRIFNSKFAEDYWLANLKLVKKTDFDAWDYQWFYSIWKNNGLTIRPSVNMIKNVGFGKEATHTTQENSRLSRLIANEINFPLSNPNMIIQNNKKDALCSKIRFGISYRSYIRNSLKKMILYIFGNKYVFFKKSYDYMVKKIC